MFTMLHLSLVSGNRYVTIPGDLRSIRYAQLRRCSRKSILFRTKRSLLLWQNITLHQALQLLIFLNIMVIGMKTFWVVAPTPDKTYAITLCYNKEPTSIIQHFQDTATGTYLSNKYADSAFICIFW